MICSIAIQFCPHIIDSNEQDVVRSFLFLITIAGIQTNIITAVSPGGVDLLEVAQMGQCLYLDVDTYTIFFLYQGEQ